MHFMIAGIRVTMKMQCDSENERLAAFFHNGFKEQDLLVEYGCFQEREDKRFLCSSLNLFFWYEIPGGFRLETHRPGEEKASGALEVDTAWKHAVLYGKDTVESEILAGPLGEVLFRNAMIHHGGIQIHSAAIAYRGESILFSAPSGTGKTTQARLWMNCFGASMVQGDRPMIRIQEESVLACGTPWVGSDPLFQNISLPVKAIVFLEQAPLNEITDLDPAVAIQYLLPRCFLPYFSKQMMDTALSIAERFLGSVSCLLLRCTPEQEAAQLLHDKLYL